MVSLTNDTKDICVFAQQHNEIELSIEVFVNSSEEMRKELIGWIRKNKLLLKEMKYKGKVPRMRKDK